MNLHKLFQLNDQNRAAQIYFATFASRRRSFSKTSVQDVVDLARRQGYALAPSDVEAFFEGLEAADCGQFVRDENGARFMWLLKANQVAHAARQKHETLAATTDEPSAQRLSHLWRGRADWTLNLELPPDFTLAEAERLCHFVMSLPLEANQKALPPSDEALSR